MGWLLLVAIIVVYIILGILYESFIHPLTILSGLPSAALGALLTLYIFHIPVTLYASVGTCDPCDSARQLLRQRGIPYSEKSVQSPEDADALERLSGGRDAPTLII